MPAAAAETVAIVVTAAVAEVGRTIALPAEGRRPLGPTGALGTGAVVMGAAVVAGSVLVLVTGTPTDVAG